MMKINDYIVNYFETTTFIIDSNPPHQLFNLFQKATSSLDKVTTRNHVYTTVLGVMLTLATLVTSTLLIYEFFKQSVKGNLRASNLELEALSIEPKDEKAILAYLHSPKLNLQTPHKHLYDHIFFTFSSKLTPFYHNFHVMTQCIYLIDKLGSDQKKVFLEGILLELERHPVNGKSLLHDDTFMRIIRQINPELAPDHAHLTTMQPLLK